MLPEDQIRYVLDADVLIAAYRQYYGPDICPGFWDFMEDKISQGELVIIDRVREEIEYPDELVNWVKHASRGVFAFTQSAHVISAYDKFTAWVETQQFTPDAKEEFARVADGWLVAYAKVADVTVVTNEIYDQNRKNAVKIPNVCEEFNVPYMNTYEMLRTLKASFKWQRSGTP